MDGRRPRRWTRPQRLAEWGGSRLTLPDSWLLPLGSAHAAKGMHYQQRRRVQAATDGSSTGEFAGKPVVAAAAAAGSEAEAEGLLRLRTQSLLPVGG